MMASSFLLGQCVGWPGLAGRGLMCLQHGFPLGGQFWPILSPTHPSVLAWWVCSFHCCSLWRAWCLPLTGLSWLPCMLGLVNRMSQPSGTIPQARLFLVRLSTSLLNTPGSRVVFFYTTGFKNVIFLWTTVLHFGIPPVLISLFIPLIFLQDLPLGLMDDIYDFISKFAQRIDETEEVKHLFSDIVYFIINKLWMSTLWKTINCCCLSSFFTNGLICRQSKSVSTGIWPNHFVWINNIFILGDKAN